MNLKKPLCIVISILLLAGFFAGCGQENPEPTDIGEGQVQNKVCRIVYNSSGYSHTWLQKAAEAFEQVYAEEGYKIELDINFGFSADSTTQIGLGPDKNDTDLYFTGTNMEHVLDASKRIMRGEGPVLLDLSECVFNKPAIGLDKKEEEKTLAERYFLDKEYLYYDGAVEEFHGGIFAIPNQVSACGIILNPTVTEKFGYPADNLPRTTDEFNQMCHVIAEQGPEQGIYPYSWAGSNASGYWGYLQYEYFAQYSGKEAFMNFAKTMPESGDIYTDGWKVYEDMGIYYSLEALEPIMKLQYSPKGSASDTHLEAQHKMLVGNTAFIVSGDWLLCEMRDEYYEEASQCIFMNAPVLSVIGEECGITDAQLSQAVKMVDEKKTNAEIMAAISGLDEAETQRIRDARNVYSCGDKAVQGGACIPAYADAKEVAVLFLRFLFSEDGCKIVRDEAFSLSSFTCESYDSVGNTAYMKSVVDSINPGEGEYISLDITLSQLRGISGMMFFNHPAFISPITFRAMITDTTGQLTADYMYHSEIEYVRAHWAQWLAYTDLKPLS